MNKKAKIKDRIFKYIGLFITLSGIIILLFFFFYIFALGVPRINFHFLTGMPSRFPEKAGILSAIIGSIWVVLTTIVFAFPIGLLAGIYLEEFMNKGHLYNIIEINISNLAGVPSVIYGILGLEIFVRLLKLGSTILTGGLTLSLLILPVIIISTRESLRAVPESIRSASFALGATKWQTVWHQLLPASMGGILTGVILSISRVIGEAAPLIVIGALAYVPFIPQSPLDQFSVIPIQIFNWISRPQKGFIVNAAAAIVILLLITVILSAIAMYFRNKWQKHFKY